MSDKNFYTSEIYGELFEPESFSKLIDKLLTLTSFKNPVGWRGQADINWRLDSSAVRRIKNNFPLKPGSDEFKQKTREYEKKLIDNAILAGHGIRNGINLTDLELLATIQHHEGATRLLDFSGNLFIALWFVCNKYPQNHGLLTGICVDPDKDKYYHINKPEDLEQKLELFLDDHKDKIIMWTPNCLYERMRIQQSFFLFSEISTLKYTSLMVDKDDLITIAISPKLKKEIKEQYKPLFGYNQKNLFPELDGFSKYHSADNSFELNFF